jgi:predicted DCC family thiol-disulfide oxidoreductase YuxK
MTDSAREQTIVFFDGVCHLCNGFVDFAVQRDHERNLLFAPLQGSTAKRSLTPEQREKLDSIMVLNKGRVLENSTAVCQVFSELGGFWRLLSAILRLIPRGLRDFIYSIVARNRYAWFGKSETCRIPTKEERGQIVD